MLQELPEAPALPVVNPFIKPPVSLWLQMQLFVRQRGAFSIKPCTQTVQISVVHLLQLSQEPAGNLLAEGAGLDGHTQCVCRQARLVAMSSRRNLQSPFEEESGDNFWSVVLTVLRNPLRRNY